MDPLMTPQAPVVLARTGAVTVKISPPANASPAEEYATEELRRHLYAMAGCGGATRILGADSPRIYVNDLAAADAAGIDVAGLRLGNESFHLETRGGDVHVLGGGPRGVLYGVYELLESLGCRWHAPDVTVIPRRANIRLDPIRRTGASAFEFRDTTIFEARDPAWWVRNRFNGACCDVPEYMGGNIRYGLFVHTFYPLVPPEEFFADHPEYYSMIGGVRRQARAQLCLSNPDVLRILTGRVLEHMRKDARATIFSVSQNDWDGHCECPACSAVAREEGAQSGPLLRFVNAVAERTSKVFPDRLIDTLAYSYTVEPPRLVRPHRNVRVRLCSICCCQGHGFGTCDHAESRRVLDALQAWSRITGQLYIWHYVTAFRHYPQPVPNWEELHYNINLYRNCGVYGLFMQGMGQDGGGAESSMLRAYVLGRLMRDPGQPLWPIVEEFLAACYGKAAGAKVRQYLKVFQDRVNADRGLHPSLFDGPESPLFSGDILQRADAPLAEAEAMSAGPRRRRVRMLRHGLTHVRLHLAAGAFRRDGDVYRGQATDNDRADFEAMIRDLRKCGVRRVEENDAFRLGEHKIRSRLIDHPVQWLRDGGQQIAVLPTIGGRLLEWHAHGRQWLCPPNPDYAWRTYPSAEGYDELVGCDSGPLGWAEPYRAARRGDSLVLSAELGHGLRIRRTYTLRSGVLHIDSRLTNRSNRPANVWWGSELHLLLQEPSSCRLCYADAEGEKVHPYDSIPEGHATMFLESALLPSEQWRVETPGFALVHSFAGSGVSQAIVGRVGRWRMLALDLKTARGQLAPGAGYRASQQIEIRQGP